MKRFFSTTTFIQTASTFITTATATITARTLTTDSTTSDCRTYIFVTLTLQY